MKKVFIRFNPHFIDEIKNYTNALHACGADTVVSLDLTLADDCDALLVPGGGDINPALYGQKNTASVGIDDDLDRDEITLIRHFFDLEKPILGICRGHQIINVALGGDMVQHVYNTANHVRLENGADNLHTMKALHPFMQNLYGDTFVVNSSHHQAVARLGEGLIPTCVSGDGITEGFIHKNGRIIGVQFHPERIGFALHRPEAVDGEKIFRAFLALL